MVKLSHMWERSEIGRFFRLDCVEARSQGEIQTGPGTVTESGKVRESHRLGQEQLSRGDTQIGGKDTDGIRNRG